MAVQTELPPLTQRINSGAFGVLYHDPRDPNRCIKTLKKPLRGDDASALNRLVEVARWARPSEVHQLLSRFAWPTETFGDAASVIAYTMPLAPDSTYFDLKVVGRTTRSALQLKFLMDADYWSGAAVQSAKPNLTLGDRMELAIDCIQSVATLHRLGLCYGDVSSNNIVARMGSRPGVFFFDADSITTPEYRDAHPLVTPGWSAPHGLDAFAIDRSRLALLVFRLFSENPNIYPDDANGTLMPAGTPDRLAAALANAYRTGSEPSLHAVLDRLLAHRDVRHQQSAFDAAVRLGWATLVVRDAPASPTPEQASLIRQAHVQVEHEAAIEASSGLEQRKLIRRASIGAAMFQMDTKPRVALAAVPTTAAELHHLIYESMFLEITGHLSESGLGSLESDSWLGRAVEHAHLELPDADLVVTTRVGEAEVRFAWPSAPIVNCARLRVVLGGSAHETIIDRGRPGVSPMRLVPWSQGGPVVVRLTPGTRSPSGGCFFGARSVERTATIPAIVVPTVQTTGRRHPNLAQPTVILDPEAMEREAREAREALRLRRRRKLVGIASVVLLVGLAGWFLANRWLFDDHADRPDLTYSSGHTSYHLEVNGSRVTMTWAGLRTDATKLEIAESSDGNLWTIRSFQSVSPDVHTVVFDVTAKDSEPLLIRVTPLLASGARVSYTQISWLTRSGLSAAPVFNDDADGFRLSWAPASGSGNDEVVGFEYRAFIEAALPSTGTTALGVTSVTISGGPTRSTPHFAVRCRFADGRFGPWIEARPVGRIRSPSQRAVLA